MDTVGTQNNNKPYSIILSEYFDSFDVSLNEVNQNIDISFSLNQLIAEFYQANPNQSFNGADVNLILNLKTIPKPLVLDTGQF